MARLPIVGQDHHEWGDILNDFLQQSLQADGRLKNGIVQEPHIAAGAVTDSKINSSAAISKTKFSPAVQSSLTKADTSVQSVNGITASDVVLTPSDIGTVTASEGSMPPANPNSDDLWYDTSTDLWKRWDGSNWMAEGSFTYRAITARPVNVKNQPNPLANAVMDGASHPLSERFVSLADAQAVFPGATNLTDEIDYWAIQTNLTESNRVLLPAGVAVLQGALVVPNGMTNGLVLEGEGQGVTILKLRDTNQSNNSVLVDQAMVQANFNANNSNNPPLGNRLTLRSFTVDGNAGQVGGSYVSGQSYGIALNGQQDLTITDVEVRNVKGWGLRIGGTSAGYSERAWLTNINAHDCYYWGVYVGFRYRKAYLAGIVSMNNGMQGPCGSTKGGTQNTCLGGFFLDCSEMQAVGLQAHGNNGDGFFFRNVFACQYTNLRATANGGAGIHILGMVSGQGQAWLAENNGTNPGHGQTNTSTAGVDGHGVPGGGKGTATGAPDIWFDDSTFGGTGPGNYGVTNLTGITGVSVGINAAAKGMWPGAEGYAVWFDDGVNGNVRFTDVSLVAGMQGTMRLPAGPNSLVLDNTQVQPQSATQPLFDFAVGAWYGPMGGIAATVNLAPGDLRLAPLIVQQACTIDQIAVECTATGASSSFRLGIYSDTTGLPGPLLLDAGTVDTSSGTGFKSIQLASPLNLQPGVYWVGGMTESGTAPQMRIMNGYIFGMPANIAAPGGSTNSALQAKNVSAGGLPGNFSGAIANVAAPRVLVHVVA